MTDAITGATYYDSVVGSEFTVIGIYERAIRSERGGIVDTEVVVDALYDGHDDPARIELNNFKDDESIELRSVPDWFDETGTRPW